jgi:hypothetical protein
MAGDSNSNDSSNSQTVPLDDDAKRLKLDQVKAEARQAIAAAQKATVAALLPSSDVKPLEGKVDVGTGVGLVAQLIGYQLLDEASARIAKAIARCGVKGADILVVEDRLLAGTDWVYEGIQHELAALAPALDQMLADLGPTELQRAEIVPTVPQLRTELFMAPLGLAAVAVSPVIGAAASLLGMFKTDYSITSREVKIGTTPLVAAVANRLVEQKHNITVDQFSLIAGSRIVADFRSVHDKRDQVEQESIKLKYGSVLPADRRIEDLRAQMKDAWTELDKALSGETTGKHQIADLRSQLRAAKADLGEVESDSASARAKVAAAEALIARFDAFATAATTAPSTGNPPLLSAALRERLHRSGDDPKTSLTHVLFVGIEGSAGETITRTSRFGRSGQVVYMGGAQVSYLVLEVKRNRLVAAGTESLLGHLQYDLKRQTAGPLTSVRLTPAQQQPESQRQVSLYSPGAQVVSYGPLTIHANGPMPTRETAEVGPTAD